MPGRQRPPERSGKIPEGFQQASRLIWDAEYASVNSIPSSHRTVASKALRVLLEDLSPVEHPCVVDAGCGNGRNAVYLSERGFDVDAIDFSDEALALARELASKRPTQGELTVRKHNLLEGLPYDDREADLVLDSYVSCHFLSPSRRRAYASEIARVLKPGGLIYSSALGEDDEFYSFLQEQGHGERQFVKDPTNGVVKRLFSRAEFEEQWGRRFAIKDTLSLRFEDNVLGEPYRRHILAVVARRPIEGRRCPELEVNVGRNPSMP